MYYIKCFLAVTGLVSMCMAQTINIKGVVKDTGGVGIANADVRLENADITATTDANGSFTLTNDTTVRNQN